MCKYKFASKDELEVHKVTHKVTHPHKCTICDVMFTDEGYKEHNDNLVSRHPVSCPLCPERFRIRKQLQKHIKIHKVKSSHSQQIHEPKVLPCNLCTSEFCKLKALIAHQVQHKNDEIEDIPPCFENAEKADVCPG